jgi:hypothetical protein
MHDFDFSLPDSNSEAWDILSETCSNEGFWRCCSAGQDGKKVEWSYMLDPSNSREMHGWRNGGCIEGKNALLVLALATCQSLSSLVGKD